MSSEEMGNLSIQDLPLFCAVKHPSCFGREQHCVNEMTRKAHSYISGVLT